MKSADLRRIESENANYKREVSAMHKELLNLSEENCFLRNKLRGVQLYIRDLDYRKK